MDALPGYSDYPGEGHRRAPQTRRSIPTLIREASDGDLRGKGLKDGSDSSGNRKGLGTVFGYRKASDAGAAEQRNCGLYGFETEDFLKALEG
jgi:hypothetical protein